MLHLHERIRVHAAPHALLIHPLERIERTPRVEDAAPCGARRLYCAKSTRPLHARQALQLHYPGSIPRPPSTALDIYERMDDCGALHRGLAGGVWAPSARGFQCEVEASPACTRCTPTLHTASPTHSYSTHSPLPTPHTTARSAAGVATPPRASCGKDPPANHVTAPSSSGKRRLPCVGEAGRWREGSSVGANPLTCIGALSYTLLAHARSFYPCGTRHSQCECGAPPTRGINPVPTLPYPRGFLGRHPTR